MSKKHTACNETSCLEVGKTLINIIIIIIIMLIFIITIITGFQLYSFFWEAKHNSALGHFEGSKTMNNNHPQHHHGLTVFLRAPGWMLLQSMLFGPCHCRVAVGAEDCVLDRIMAVFKNKQSKQVLVRVLVWTTRINTQVLGGMEVTWSGIETNFHETQPFPGSQQV